jgi:hypothetical protein
VTAHLTSTLLIDGQTYKVELAAIERVFLGVEDHGLLTLDLTLAGPSWGQTFGGYALDGKPEDSTGDRTPTRWGMAYITAVIRVVGDLGDARGKRVYALREKDYGPIVGIADLNVQNVFRPAVDLERWKTT